MAEAKGTAVKAAETQTKDGSLSVSHGGVTAGMPTIASSTATDMRMSPEIQSNKATSPSSTDFEKESCPVGGSGSNPQSLEVRNIISEVSKKGETSVPVEAISPSVEAGDDRDTVDKPQGPLVSSISSKSSIAAVTNNKSTVMSAKDDKKSITTTVGKSNEQTTLVFHEKRKATNSESHSNNSPSTVFRPFCSGSTERHVLSTKSPDVVGNSDTSVAPSHFCSTTTMPSFKRAGGADVSTEEANILPLGEAEDAIRTKRAPLVDKYPPYIINTDTSLAEARRRLRIALDQTRQLRAAFTERVYDKYRICLKPPPQTEQILETLRQDPRGMYKKLQTEMKRTKAEKDIEKKEAQKKNSEDQVVAEKPIDKPSLHTDSNQGNHPNSVNSDGSEALMYVTSGLSLIVLPEANPSDIDMTMYNERGPVDSSSGQRARGISSAAATAGEAVLERARKGRALRAERENKNAGGNDSDSPAFNLPHDHFDTYYSKNVECEPSTISHVSKILRQTPSTGHPKKSPSPTINDRGISAAKGSGKTAVGRNAPNIGKQSKSAVIHSAATAKAIRARVQATMSMTTLLSLNPVHEELRNDTKYNSSTLAMMERGVGWQSAQNVQQHKNNTHRYKHPFPNSLGGRRRVLGNGFGDGNVPNLPLPSLPTLKERRQRREMKVLTRAEAANQTAEHSIARTIRQFDADDAADSSPGPPSKKRRITEIDFLRELVENSSKADSASTPQMDSTLVLNVMKSVGLLTTSSTGLSNENRQRMPIQISALFDKTKLRAAGVPVDSGPFFDSIEKLKSLESEMSRSARLSKNLRQRVNEELKKGNLCSDKAERVDSVALRGGGGEVAISRDKGKEEELKATRSEKAHGSTRNPVSTASSTVPTRSSDSLPSHTMSAPTNGYQNVLWDDRSHQQMMLFQPSLLSNGTGVSQSRNGTQLLSADHYHQTNALQLAHQLRLSRIPNGGHPTAGDLSEYIGGLNPQQTAYDWSSVGAVSAAAAVASTHSLAALGLNQNRHHMVPLTVQEHNRAFLNGGQRNLAAAQRQQAVAMLGGAGVNHPYGSSGYPQLAGHLLNHTATAMIGQNGIQRTPVAEVNSRQASANGPVKLVDPSVPAAQDSDGGKAMKMERTTGGVSEDCQNMPEADKKRKASSKSDINGKAQKKSRSNSTADPKVPANHEGSKPDIVEKTPPLCSSVGVTAEGFIEEEGDGEKLTTPTGLQFFVPPTPDSLSSETATHVLSGRCHDAITKSMFAMPAEDGLSLVNYIIAVGFAVPIPKAMVMHRLKDRLSDPMFKTSGTGGIPASSRDVIAAEIMIWLWRNHEDCFQRAFSKSGRIDVDMGCKWVVDAAVNKTVSALSDQITKDLSNRSQNSLASSIIYHKSKCISGKGGNSNEVDALRSSAAKVDLLVSLCVSKALNMSFSFNNEADKHLPSFHDQISYLDEARKCALFLKSQERVLLANIVSRKATMSFSFSHSYVSAMVRAGEALGHGSLFEAVQNERYGVSTMIPYDVFTDESYAWEDPCRPLIGYARDMSGDEMMRRAHARAMIQKSLKKLQERHNVKGGTPIAGPYSDQKVSQSTTSTPKLGGSSTPRGLSQRRRSLSDAPMQQGSGAAAATSSSLYDPKHNCPALVWESRETDNSPYGRHNKNTRARSLSLAQGAAVKRLSARSGKSARRQNVTRQVSDHIETSLTSPHEDRRSETLGRSTREIPWKDVAGIFQKVQLPGTPKEKQNPDTRRLSDKDRTIFAPIVRMLSRIPEVQVDDISDDEDLSNDAVLARHQVVLNEMKVKLAAFQENRKKSQDRKKSRDKSHK